MNRVGKVLALMFGLWVYVIFFEMDVPSETGATPLLVEATIADIMGGMIAPLLNLFLVWKMWGLLTDD